jgi:hypothetical protein
MARELVFGESAPTTGADVMQLRLDGTHAVTPLVRTPFSERNGEVSPDGRWLAYDANDSGRFEIYVRPFPDVSSGHWQVSMEGGTRPLWARDGHELFFLAPTGALMRVGVARGSTWVATAPTKLFEGHYGAPAIFLDRTYDVSPDGRRFLMIKPGRFPGRDRRPGQLRRRPALDGRAEASGADEPLMTLITGTHLGPYEILSALGAGGMGEVYRARDTRLNRDVAIKVLPDLFASDADRLARFTARSPRPSHH